MRRDLSPAFVITLVTLVPACKKSPAEIERERIGPLGSDPVVVVADAAAAAKPTVDPKTLRHRSVREGLPEPKESKVTIDWARAERLNGKNADGAWIYAADEGHCYTGVPTEHAGAGHAHNHNPPAVADPEYAQRPIDCPEAMLDPAWDTCLDAQLIRVEVGKDECVCDRHGNPPPPATVAECPKPKATAKLKAKPKPAQP